MKLGWVDFSREDRELALDALDSLQEHGAVDELGIGTLRDAFSNAFFPGTSTLQTRAKYFVIVPCAVLKTMTECIVKPGRRWDATTALSEIRKIEHECASQMLKNLDGDEDDSGIIGRTRMGRRDWILRPPSELYWAGLRIFGISSTSESVRSWVGHWLRFVAENGGVAGETEREREEGVDDDAGTQIAAWKSDFFIPAEISVPFAEAYAAESISIRLTAAEATFLADRIENAPDSRNSLLAFCLRNKIRIPRMVPESDETPPIEDRSPFFRFARSVRERVPGDMRQLLDDACRFNRLVFSARVLYNRMLEDPENGAEEIWEEIAPLVPEWMAFDLNAIFDRFSMPRTSSLGRFLFSLRDAFQNRNTGMAETLIRRREEGIKGRSRAKLANPGKVESGKWVGGGWLDFRLGNAARIVEDIFDAKEATHA